MTVLSPELAALAASVRRRAWRDLSGHAAELDRDQRFSPAVWDVVRRLGVVPLCFAEEEGGAGGSALALVVALEQVAYACAVAALYPGTTIQVARAVLDHAQPALSARWAPRLVTGDALAAWAFTEPQTGSDPEAADDPCATRRRRLGAGG